MNKVVDELGLKIADLTGERIKYPTVVIRIYSKETGMASFKQHFFKKSADIGKNMKSKVFNNTATAETVAQKKVDEMYYQAISMKYKGITGKRVGPIELSVGRRM